jgi:hypothetical protein
MKDERRKKLLIAYDGSICAEAALDDLPRAGLPPKAESLVLTIAEELILAPASFGGVDTAFPQAEFAEQQKALALAQQTRARLQTLFPGWELQTDAGLGSPGSEILARADEWRPI